MCLNRDWPIAIASFTHYASDTIGECSFIWFLLVCICLYYKFPIFLAPFHLCSFQHCLKPPVVERWLLKAVAIISIFKQGDGYWKTNNQLDACFQSMCYIKDDWVSLEHHAIWKLHGKDVVDFSAGMLVYIGVLWYSLVISNDFTLGLPF